MKTIEYLFKNLLLTFFNKVKLIASTYLLCSKNRIVIEALRNIKNTFIPLARYFPFIYKRNNITYWPYL